ncbi:ADP-ribosylhydrolase ARH3-like [Saccoglossus kowalevskii]|uniref:ADP-ribosylhydrolase ARH3 n=1 Tax=Saccoglossus kowalevskii TaxID=10224 RepID=A0ABM0MHR6_SACKO|nr:PREDICTED: poly(ADP-ribose) glycohydrolase ARH3-like [Saccoglossus kowalevskii]
MAASASLVSRFRACLASAVAGDVLGSEFEGISAVSLKAATQHVERFSSNTDERQLEFTDDTAMARSICVSLIHNKGYNAKHMARRFAEEYKRQPHRGYGGNVISVFEQLLDESLLDVYEPSRKQFDGSGSYGNGGAMRIAPVALFAYNDLNAMKKIAKESTLLTHSNYLGYNGALLQCAAVYYILHSSQPFDVDNYLDQLHQFMHDLEEETKPETSYCVKIKKIKDMLQDSTLSNAKVVETLGHGIAAYESVPTAIHAFIHCLEPVKDRNSNGILRTIIYAITLGGDTDTIATMAAAIAGAYYGMEQVPDAWSKSCEGVDDAIEYADQLYKLCNNN